MAKKKESKEKKSKELVKTEPSRALSRFEEMERLFEDVFRRPFSLLGPSWLPRLRFPEIEELAPSVDIFEDTDNVVIKAELPGMKKEDIDVNLTDDTITISGEKKKEEKVEKKNYYRLERSHGSFSRSFRLPKEVQTDKAKAKFKDGVLQIKIPKTAEAKKKEKKVTIE
ncbi:MAG TPA: Hsp20/alpha crystallin family protein [Nitrospirae bacterium]|nr:spore protein SP21 [bacterium BMS3Abin08]HDO25962.1 Hsp20/alpha crystallin family protein [Nitrospirota bacterium]